MKVTVTRQARKDLEQIFGFIASDSPAAAAPTLDRIEQAFGRLAKFPELGRAWKGGPTRALSIAGLPYRVHYRVLDDELQILRIYHTSRMPPPAF